MADETAAITVNVKGPTELKLSVSISPSATVAEFKQVIGEACPEGQKIEPAQQRLIYSGKVLKDEELVSKYGLKDGHTIHLVKGARPAGATPAVGSSSGAGASAASQAAGVPSNFAAGQQYAGNPLAPLLNAQNAGALAGFNPFAQMGINPNDPNYMTNMLQDPNVQQQVQGLLADPQVIDQIIASNPELRALGPSVRSMMQSEQFRQFITNPEAMRNMAQMQQMMGGAGGGMGGFGGGAGGAAPPPFPPPGAFGGAVGAAGATPSPGAGGPAQPNPFNMFGGAGAGGGGQADFNAMMENARQLAAQFGAPGAAGAGGAGGGQDFAGMLAAMQGFGGGAPGGAGSPAPQQPQQPPEERFATQLAQLQDMGFYDGQQNVRALLACGGNVQAAIEYLFGSGGQ